MKLSIFGAPLGFFPLTKNSSPSDSSSICSTSCPNLSPCDALSTYDSGTFYWERTTAWASAWAALMASSNKRCFSAYFNSFFLAFSAFFLSFFSSFNFFSSYNCFSIISNYSACYLYFKAISSSIGGFSIKGACTIGKGSLTTGSRFYSYYCYCYSYSSSYLASKAYLSFSFNWDSSRLNRFSKVSANSLSTRARISSIMAYLLCSFYCS